MPNYISNKVWRLRDYKQEIDVESNSGGYVNARAGHIQQNEKDFREGLVLTPLK